MMEAVRRGDLVLDLVCTVIGPSRCTMVSVALLHAPTLCHIDNGHRLRRWKPRFRGKCLSVCALGSIKRITVGTRGRPSISL